jgi:prophage tail gpP-like protein
MDNFSTAEFKTPFEPDRIEFRKIFRPFSFKPLQVLVDNEPFFTGTLVGLEPERTAEESSATISGYSLPAVIQECTAPGSSVPHSWEKIGLRAITEAILAPFKLGVAMMGDEGAKFEKLALKEGKKIYEFLVELAQQRGMVISNTKGGDLLYWRSVEPGNPVARIAEDVQALVKISAKFNAQEYYSEVTGFTPATRRKTGTQHTEPNPWLRTVLRPLSFHLDDIDKGDVVQATKAKLGRVFANMAAYSVENIPTWRDPNGHLWEPNTTLKLLAPSAMCYHESELIIRNVTLTQSSKKWTSALDLVLPGAFSGKIPQHVPWEEEAIKPDFFDMDYLLSGQVF